jgi:zinc transporter, ZIP family
LPSTPLAHEVGPQARTGERPIDAEALPWIVAAGLATGLGGLWLLLVPRPSDLLLDVLLGFTAGIMLAATAFSLLVPALELGRLVEVLAGVAAGGVALLALDAAVPHVHLRFAEGGQTDERAAGRALLLLSALTIHNVPEGLAVGVAFAAGGPELGVPVALAIGIQNVPEGFAAAAPLLAAGAPRRTAVAVAAATGAVEPPAALVALVAFGAATALLPFGLAFAAGAMLYVIVDELIPESHARGNERAASVALLIGFLLMLVLDRAFG